MSPPSNRPKKLVILNDGTWCGRETGTTTNVSLLATMMGIDMKNPTPSGTYEIPPSRQTGAVKARYFEGGGLGGTFLEYLFNGATGSDIGQECVNVYSYIVENYEEDMEIWMFGHSRGSYTARCVAGMINNCGIIKKWDLTASQRADLCQEVYKLYLSPYPDEKPNTDKMQIFRDQASWDVETPIKFMGLIDTVGALGIPKLDSGGGFTWPEFFDQNVSSEVETVYHACSMHDRLWMFQPCRARRDPVKHPNNAGVHEKWFPGCHYDVGRQQFKLLRGGGSAVEQMVFFIPRLFTTPIMPNLVCADMVLLWLLKAIDEEDKIHTLIPDLDNEIAEIQRRLKSDDPARMGTGDVYGHTLDYLPTGIFGSALGVLSNLTVKITDQLSPSLKLGTAIQGFLGIRTIVNILLATKDRRIPGVDVDTVMLRKPDPTLGNVSVSMKAGLTRCGRGAYASKTFESFQTYLRAVNIIDEETFQDRTVGWD